MLCSDRHSRASFSIVFSCSLSPQEYFLTLVPSLFHLFFSARCSWPSSNQSPNDATTHLLFTLIRSILLSYLFLLSCIHFFLSLSRLSLLIVYFLSLFRRTHDAQIFYMCVCVRSFLLFFIFCVCVFLYWLFECNH